MEAFALVNGNWFARCVGLRQGEFVRREVVRAACQWMELIEPYGSVEGKPSVDGNWFARRVVIITVAVDRSSSSSQS